MVGSLQSAVCSLQSAVCRLQSAVCKCHTPISQQVTYCVLQGGSRWTLRKGAVPLKWNEGPKEDDKKRKVPGQRETSLNVNKLPPKNSNQDHSVKQLSTTSEIVQLGNTNVDSLRILACKALCKFNNELVQKVKLLTSNKDKSPIFFRD